MTLAPKFVVHIGKQPDGFAETMNVVRSWLDHHKIESASFRPVADYDGSMGFDIGFISEDEAQLFRTAFVDLSSASEREGDQVLGTGYYLIHRFGQTDAFEYTNLSFSTETEATAHACSLIAAGELGNFVIKDSKSRVVADDAAIKAHCIRHPIDYKAA